MSLERKIAERCGFRPEKGHVESSQAQSFESKAIRRVFSF